MIIKDIRATLHRVPVALPLVEEGAAGHRRIVLVQVEAGDGVVGHGLTGQFLAHAVIAALHHHIAPAVRGMDARHTEPIHARIAERTNPRAMTGAVSMALSALDIALWDIAGNAAGLPVSTLLGGAKRTLPAYCTFGFPLYDREALGEVAKRSVSAGFRAVKVVVGVHEGGWREDAARIRTVRDAVGPEIDIMIDANEMFAPTDALKLAKALEPVGIAWFEEPVHRNDVRHLSDLRRKTTIPIAAGQMEGSARRLREFVAQGAVDIVQPNVAYCGGFTVGRKVAHMAEAFALPIANGGGWPMHNLHLMAAMANGAAVEWHLEMVSVCNTLFSDAPQPAEGLLSVADRPGLGLGLRDDAYRETMVDA